MCNVHLIKQYVLNVLLAQKSDDLVSSAYHGTLHTEHVDTKLHTHQAFSILPSLHCVMTINETKSILQLCFSIRQKGTFENSGVYLARLST